MALYVTVHAKQEASIAIHSSGFAKLKLALVMLDHNGHVQDEFTKTIARDFSFSGQWHVDIVHQQKMPRQRDIKNLFKAGYHLAIFFSYVPKENTVEWRLYDTMQARMIEGKKCAQQGKPERVWAHAIADSIWQKLNNQESPFLSCIAYCKEVSDKENKWIKQVCLAEYDGSYEKVIVHTPTINVAPRWNNDKKPLLFYSEYTPANVRLMVVDMQGKRTVASNFDGITMVPAFSDDGKQVVFCASHGDGACHLYRAKKGELKKLTSNNANNISPTFGKNNECIYFCSDVTNGVPYLYRYSCALNAVEPMVTSGYCASPSYCAKKDALVYAKRIKGVSQLFMYDGATKKHTQLTFDEGNKEECSWSPCGNYIVYAVQKGALSRIAVFNMGTGESRCITPATIQASYPCWSPRYEHYPLV